MDNFIKTDTIHKTVSVGLEVLMIKEGDYIVAFCPALDLTSYGDDELEAKSAFEEALEIFLEETHSRGTLERVLLDLGWGLRKLPSIKYEPPKKNYTSKYTTNTKLRMIKEQVLIPID